MPLYRNTKPAIIVVGEGRDQRDVQPGATFVAHSSEVPARWFELDPHNGYQPWVVKESDTPSDVELAGR